MLFLFHSDYLEEMPERLLISVEYMNLSYLLTYLLIALGIASNLLLTNIFFHLGARENCLKVSLDAYLFTEQSYKM